MSSFKYLVLGGGNASGYAAKEFVKRGVNKGELCIITDEEVVSYERPALSKAYLFPGGPARLPGFHTCVGMGMDRQEPAFYEEHGIEFKTGTKVTAVDVGKKSLTTEKGESFTYDKLIVATGARPVKLTEFKVPGAELSGLNYLRDIKDADALVAAMEECKAKDGKVVIVGGGYIGMECAAAVAMNKLPVTMVFPEGHLMSRLLDPEVGQFYADRYKAEGVTIVTGQVATSFEGENGKVTHVNLKSGEKLPADLVVVGVGARANKELFEDQLEMAAGGIKVNGKLQTSNPDVYAVGDVAAFPLKVKGGELQRQEHVTNCRLSAFHAVSAIMAPEETEDYDYFPFFYSRIFNLSWQFYGISASKPIMFGDKEAGKIGMYWVDEGKVVGAMLESGTPEEFAAIKAVAKAQPPAPSPEELVKQGLEFALKVAAAQ
ncbi:hypothetical protein BSKO_06027 [Bryopsis sp. KO-2023]|nr:hypothetical protein BSKO_06027 [Bryopsis sp. KO-2023]